MKYKGIIFDLDGVICFTDVYHYEAWKKLADSENIYFDEVINNRLRGISRMESLNIILERAERSYLDKEKQEMVNRKNEIYKNLLRKLSPLDLDEETKQTLDKLKTCGCRLAIGSSSKNAKYILERLGLADYFDAVSDGNNIRNSKPDPQVFIIAAEFLGLSPKECLVVEDASSGINAAIAGGFDSAGIGEAAKHYQVTYALKSISDLLDIQSS